MPRNQRRYVRAVPISTSHTSASRLVAVGSAMNGSKSRAAGTRRRPPAVSCHAVKVSSGSLAVRDALCEGFGVSLVPYWYVERDLKAGRLQLAMDDWTMVETTLYAIYPARQHLAPKIRAFLDFLIEEFSRKHNGDGAGHPSGRAGRGSHQ